MDLLEYGMKNQDSASSLKKAAARGALAAAKVQADLYEKYLEKKIRLPEENEEETLAMLKRIEEIAAGTAQE